MYTSLNCVNTLWRQLNKKNKKIIKLKCDKKELLEKIEEQKRKMFLSTLNPKYPSHKFRKNSHNPFFLLPIIYTSIPF